MDSSLAPAVYGGTLLFVLHFLVEANFFEMMSDLFEVYPLWGVVLSISFRKLRLDSLILFAMPKKKKGGKKKKGHG